MKKKILSLALAVTLILAIVPAASAAGPEKTPVFLEEVTVSVPGVPDMVLTMSGVFDHYFFRESDGAVLFLSTFPSNDETGEPFYPIVFDRDVTLTPMPAGITMWAGFEDANDTDIAVKAGEPVYSGGLRHSYTVGGVAIHFLGIDQLPPHIFIYGSEEYGTEGLEKEVAGKGFKMLPMSDIAGGEPTPPADSPSAWAVSEVNAAIAAGLVPESLQKNYQKTVTRGAVATMFIRLIENASGMSIDEFMKEKGVEADPNAFSDTDDPAVLATNALGIIRGKGDGKFGPDGTLLRSEIAAVICRVARVLDVETEGYTHSFTDITGHWVETEIGWPVHMGIIRGVSDTEFNASGLLTTEQAIAITYRALTALKK